MPRNDIEELTVLEKEVSEAIASRKRTGTDSGEQYRDLLKTKALLSIASSLASLEHAGITTYKGE